MTARHTGRYSDRSRPGTALALGLSVLIGALAMLWHFDPPIEICLVVLLGVVATFHIIDRTFCHR